MDKNSTPFHCDDSPSRVGRDDHNRVPIEDAATRYKRSHSSSPSNRNPAVVESLAHTSMRLVATGLFPAEVPPVGNKTLNVVYHTARFYITLQKHLLYPPAVPGIRQALGKPGNYLQSSPAYPLKNLIVFASLFINSMIS